MRRVTHSDNLCTSGMTCLTAVMEPKDMYALLKVCPDGDFTPCFCRPGNQGPRIDSPNKLRTSSMKAGILYFNFKEDRRGQRLLRLLFSGGKLDYYGRPFIQEIDLADLVK